MLAGIAGALLIIAGGMAVTLAGHAPPARLSLAVVLAGGLGMLTILLLAVARYDAAVLLGFLLFAVVRWEPAPTDIVFMVVIAVAIVTGRFDLRRVPLAVTALVGMFLVLNLLSTIEIVNTSKWLFFIITTFYLAFFGLWLPSYVTSVSRMRWIVRAYLSAAVFAASVGIFGLVTHIGEGLLTSSKDLSRAQAFFKDPNVFGPFFVPMALILISEILSPRLLLMPRVAKLCLLLLLSVGVLISYSRAAWISYAIGVLMMIIVYALRRGGGKKALTLLVIAVALVAGLTLVTAFTGSARFFESRTHLQTYDQGRFATQRSGLDLALRYPIGVGPGQFETREPRSAHSTYVRAIAEQGILGIVTVVSLLLLTLFYAARNAIAGRDTYGVGSAPLLGAWCGLLVNSAVVDTFHWRHLWLVAALIWIGEARRRIDSKKRPTLERGLTTWAPTDLAPPANADRVGSS